MSFIATWICLREYLIGSVGVLLPERYVLGQLVESDLLETLILAR